MKTNFGEIWEKSFSKLFQTELSNQNFQNSEKFCKLEKNFKTKDF